MSDDETLHIKRSPTPLDRKIFKGQVIATGVMCAGIAGSWCADNHDITPPNRRDNLKITSHMAWAAGAALSLYLLTLPRSKEYKKYAGNLPKFLGLTETQQRAGLAAVARDLKRGAITLDDETIRSINAHSDDGRVKGIAVVDLLEKYASDPALVAAETTIYERDLQISRHER